MTSGAQDLRLCAVPSNRRTMAGFGKVREERSEPHVLTTSRVSRCPDVNISGGHSSRLRCARTPWGRCRRLLRHPLRIDRRARGASGGPNPRRSRSAAAGAERLALLLLRLGEEGHAGEVLRALLPRRPRGPHEQPDREPECGRRLPGGAGPLVRRGSRPDRHRHPDREHAILPCADPGAARPALGNGGGARRAGHRPRGEDAGEHRDARRGRQGLPVPRLRCGQGDDQ